ncbi:GAF and ANTAR domain-containing protein [Jatrophihabitans sp.]|uniref:GAF and ANTAR domain-containing protein n=1 Tax=Jatrophihabitans sp. TaxID=1932789 RepID=UPI002B6D191A|nr:GAF and ANTAR domain-containing protein [Jatrophihabitans sp.]
MSELLDPAEAADPQGEPWRVPGSATLPDSGGESTTVFAAALTELAMAVQAGKLDPLVVLAEGATDVIPGTEFSILVTPAGPGRLAAQATSGTETLQVVDLQNEVGEGPGLDAVSQPEPVWVPDLATEDRWPLFTPAARELGVASMLCTPLVTGDRVLGALNLAASRPHAFNEESQAMASLFAAHATIALAGQEWHRNLTTALDSRDVIGQAKGILMERFRVTPDAAFALLVKASQRTHTKLRTISEELCRTGVLRNK